MTACDAIRRMRQDPAIRDDEGFPVDTPPPRPSSRQCRTRPSTKPALPACGNAPNPISGDSVAQAAAAGSHLNEGLSIALGTTSLVRSSLRLCAIVRVFPAPGGGIGSPGMLRIDTCNRTGRSPMRLSGGCWALRVVPNGRPFTDSDPRSGIGARRPASPVRSPNPRWRVRSAVWRARIFVPTCSSADAS